MSSSEEGTGATKTSGAEAQEDYGARTFRLDGHPHLRHVRVAAPDLAAYNDLLKSQTAAL